MQIWTLDLFNTGGRGEHRKVGMDTHQQPDIPRMPYDRARIVLQHNGRVYTTADIMQTLNMSTWEQPALVLPRTNRKLWEVTRRQLSDALESTAYPDRSEHERMVSERNFQAIAWLESLLS